MNEERFAREMTKVQSVIRKALQKANALATLADGGTMSREKLQLTLEETAYFFEAATLYLRQICEAQMPGVGGYGRRDGLEFQLPSGHIEIAGAGWVHMLNHIVVMGRLTRDPELRKTAAGVSVTSFTVAVDRDFSQDGQKETDFLDVVAWRNTAEFAAKYFTKGRMAVVSGRLQIRNWEDKEGNKRRTAEILAENIYFGDSKKEDDGGSASTSTQGFGAPAQTGGFTPNFGSAQPGSFVPNFGGNY